MSQKMRLNISSDKPATAIHGLAETTPGKNVDKPWKGRVLITGSSTARYTDRFRFGSNNDKDTLPEEDGLTDSFDTKILSLSDTKKMIVEEVWKVEEEVDTFTEALIYHLRINEDAEKIFKMHCQQLNNFADHVIMKSKKSHIIGIGFMLKNYYLSNNLVSINENVLASIRPLIRGKHHLMHSFLMYEILALVEKIYFEANCSKIMEMFEEGSYSENLLIDLKEYLTDNLKEFMDDEEVGCLMSCTSLMNADHNQLSAEEILKWEKDEEDDAKKARLKKNYIKLHGKVVSPVKKTPVVVKFEEQHHTNIHVCIILLNKISYHHQHTFNKVLGPKFLVELSQLSHTSLRLEATLCVDALLNSCNDGNGKQKDKVTKALRSFLSPLYEVGFEESFVRKHKGQLKSFSNCYSEVLKKLVNKWSGIMAFVESEEKDFESPVEILRGMSQIMRENAYFLEGRSIIADLSQELLNLSHLNMKFSSWEDCTEFYESYHFKDAFESNLMNNFVLSNFDILQTNENKKNMNLMQCDQIDVFRAFRLYVFIEAGLLLWLITSATMVSDDEETYRTTLLLSILIKMSVEIMPDSKMEKLQCLSTVSDLLQYFFGSDDLASDYRLVNNVILQTRLQQLEAIDSRRFDTNLPTLSKINLFVPFAREVSAIQRKGKTRHVTTDMINELIVPFKEIKMFPKANWQYINKLMEEFEVIDEDGKFLSLFNQNIFLPNLLSNMFAFANLKDCFFCEKSGSFDEMSRLEYNMACTSIFIGIKLVANSADQVPEFKDYIVQYLNSFSEAFDELVISIGNGSNDHLLNTKKCLYEKSDFYFAVISVILGANINSVSGHVNKLLQKLSKFMNDCPSDAHIRLIVTIMNYQSADNKLAFHILKLGLNRATVPTRVWIIKFIDNHLNLKRYLKYGILFMNQIRELISLEYPTIVMEEALAVFTKHWLDYPNLRIRESQCKIFIADIVIYRNLEAFDFVTKLISETIEYANDDYVAYMLNNWNNEIYYEYMIENMNEIFDSTGKRDDLGLYERQTTYESVERKTNYQKHIYEILGMHEGPMKFMERKKCFDNWFNCATREQPNLKNFKKIGVLMITMAFYIKAISKYSSKSFENYIILCKDLLGKSSCNLQGTLLLALNIISANSNTHNSLQLHGFEINQNRINNKQYIASLVLPTSFNLF